MWRGWLKNGQSLEVNWGRYALRFGAGVLTHSNDDDNGSRMICINFWRASIYIPIGISRGPFAVGDEPQYSIFGDSEGGLVAHWGLRSWSWDWPWSLQWHRTSLLLNDGAWAHDTAADQKKWRKSNPPGCGRYRPSFRDLFKDQVRSETHPYTYHLKSGEVQNVTATITVEEMEWRRKWMPFSRLFALVRKSIDIHFSSEVGERSGSWKGGCIGCSYEMRSGETPLETLSRMERERKF